MADPEKPKTIMESIRRFADARISSVLHSLIGLPSMLQPPPNCGEDGGGGEASGRVQAAPTATNKAPSTPSQPRGGGQEGEEEEEGGGGGGGGGGNKRVAGDSCGGFGNPLLLRFGEDVVGGYLESLTLIPFPHIPEEAFSTRDEKCMDGRLWEALGMAVGEKHRRAEWLGSARAPTPSASETPSSKIISSLTPTHTFTGPDGVARTNYVFKPRFADDSEESVAEEPTERPRS